MLFRGVAFVLVWPALALVLQAQTYEEDDVIVPNQPAHATRTGFSGWWQRQVDMNRSRQRSWGGGSPTGETDFESDDVVVVPQQSAARPHNAIASAGSTPNGRPSGSVAATPVMNKTYKTVPVGVATPFNAPGPPGYVPAGYAAVNAPLYPCPKPGIPLGTGATVITNPALYPHEMLYPHEYRGMYGPYYYRTRRAWIMTPLGIYKHEKRILTGTEVHVKYKSYISPFTLFYPPVGKATQRKPNW
jgi:hypothetical protein